MCTYAYLITYISPERGACYDVQRGATLLDAMCAHFLTFPASTGQAARVLS